MKLRPIRDLLTGRGTRSDTNTNTAPPATTSDSGNLARQGAHAPGSSHQTDQPTYPPTRSPSTATPTPLGLTPTQAASLSTHQIIEHFYNRYPHLRKGRNAQPPEDSSPERDRDSDHSRGSEAGRQEDEEDDPACCCCCPSCRQGFFVWLCLGPCCCIGKAIAWTTFLFLWRRAWSSTD